MEKIKEILKNNKIKDAIALGILILVYSVISFINLGSTTNPQTFGNFFQGDEVTFELEKESEISKIRYFLGDVENSFNIYVSIDGSEYSYIEQTEGQSLFSWSDLKINQKVKYIKIFSPNNGKIGEIQAYDNFSNSVNLYTLNDEGKKLIDEPQTVPDVISYKNSAYFDEVYFATSAYEYANGLPAIEYTHPHLGKMLQSIPVILFGMSPFSYRLMGNLAGIAMIIVMYVLGKLLFKKSRYAFLSAFLMAFDNFHFAQTRIGTVDSFLVLFCVMSALFMFKYFMLDNTAILKKKLYYLFLCGLFFGLGVCVKWIGFYTGLGLAILFLGKMVYDSIKLKKFEKQNIIIILMCIVFFVIIPSIVYITIYFNFETVYGKITSIRDFFEMTKTMFEFHSSLEAEHPFTSKWYTWPIILKPVWFYVNNINNSITSTISNIGNPSIWWPGIISLIYVLIVAIIKRKKEYIFILVMYLSVLMPYMVIGRVMFLYHYFMALPFVMLANTAFVKFLSEKLNKKCMVFYMVIVFVMFWIFYPVASGMPVQETYIKSLRWFDTWVF